MQTLSTGYLIRLDRGEEIIKQLQLFALKIQPGGAFFIGLGAVRSARIGMYYTDKQEYLFRDITTPHEITNITGNISWYESEPMIHAHATLADAEQRTVGGHLDQATVEPTCELSITLTDKPLHRAYNPNIGLPLLDL